MGLRVIVELDKLGDMLENLGLQVFHWFRFPRKPGYLHLESSLASFDYPFDPLAKYLLSRLGFSVLVINTQNETRKKRERKRIFNLTWQAVPTM